jgi:hypothetical protein
MPALLDRLGPNFMGHLVPNGRHVEHLADRFEVRAPKRQNRTRYLGFGVPDYAVAMFDLGGAHWNSGNAATAAKVWTAAMERFPDHELSAKLQCDFSFLFGNPAAGQPGDGAR